MAEPAVEIPRRLFHTLWGDFRRACRKLPQSLRLCQGFSSADSVGAERCPPGTSAPRRGVLRASGTRPGPTGAEAKTPTKSLPPEAFSTFLRLLEANKTLGRWSHLPVRSAQGVCHRQTAPYNPQLLKKLAKLLRSLRSASCAHVRYPLDEHERQRAAKGAN